MKSSTAKFFRRTIYLLLLLLAIAGLLIAIFLNQLNLDDYRQELEQELSNTLAQPVQIGRSELTFNNGIALAFQDLRIGPPEALLAEVPQLTANLRIAPLLDGRVIFNRVEINNPRLQLWLPLDSSPKQGTTNQLTDKFGISVLTIRGASLKVHQRQKTGSRQLLNLQNLNTELRGWQPNQATNLVVSGQLQQQQQPANFLIDFTLPSSPDPAVWRNEELRYQLAIDNLATSALTTAEQQKLPTNVNLSISATGIPAKGAQLTAVMINSQGGEPLFDLAGRWSSSAEQEAITKLSGELLGLPLAGEFYLLRQKQQQLLAGRFGATDVTLTTQLLERWHIPGADKLQAGKLERLELILEKNWQMDQPMKGLPRIGAEVTLSNLKWAGNKLQQLDGFSAVLSLEDQVLDIKDGQLIANRQPISFSGQIKNLVDEPQLDLQIKLHPNLTELFEQSNLPSGWKLSGTLPTTLVLNGPLLRPDFVLQADLSKTELELGTILQKPANQQSSLRLEGLVDAEQLQLDQLELQLPGLSITGNGCFSHDPSSNFFLLDIDPINLASLQSHSPLLKKLQLQGTLHPTVERSESGLKGDLLLIDVGAHLNNIVGDLNRTNGKIALDQTGLHFQNLTASFGKSDFVLNGQLNNWQQPQLDLKLQSDQVRARDLIFANQKLRLYDLNGQLQIDRNGINFNSVKVRLEKDTLATVTGSVNNFSTPQVTLDIQAEKGNIDQVIALFVGPRKTHKGKKVVDHKPILISVKAAQGTIGNLHFNHAEGLIKDHGGVLTIYPLHFQSGNGTCQARVEFDRNQQNGLLKISGHAEDLDASVLHQDLFKKRGLISGNLRGDFYLEGSLADNKFWHNAIGGIALQVKDGTLRKFRSLARVFSLLNVSQLFAGKLPDMDREGMPFTLLEGSIKIANGRAKTEDLRIISPAMNMSLVGSQSLLEDSINYNLGVMPLRTVDKIITSIPIAGWILTGEDEALLTTYFKIEGSGESPKVTAVPIDSVSNTVFGILKRTITLPGKLSKDIGTLLRGEPKKQEEPAN